ncbi:unnamed protein product [Chondrus crispus]|uniref:Uncharacterized protein n=1 Tax=Chondrus crispus TaxID=2769 RepID=R7Q8D3_CHOCR|nr:unnamed protein product [Chondrus crispus]CDF33641.1 unnamed protein product [Chondrus crispus]|eukprot:XP_005713460.1 unnamed protein product [Chondrus crispus]
MYRALNSVTAKASHRQQYIVDKAERVTLVSETFVHCQFCQCLPCRNCAEEYSECSLFRERGFFRHFLFGFIAIVCP